MEEDGGQMRKWALVTLSLACGAVAAFEIVARKPDVPPTGRILAEFYENIGGTAIQDLTGSPTFPAAPSLNLELTSFETPTDRSDDYGTRVRGWLHPPLTGEYVFWIASDDVSELYVSTTDRPEQKVKIASVAGWRGPREWTGEENQQSGPVRLEAGRRYYVEALHKEGGGGDNLAVGWKLPDGKEEKPIPGSRLSPCRPTPVPPPRVVSRTTPLPMKPGHHKLSADIEVLGKVTKMPYLVYLPRDFAPRPGLRWPMLLFLHGAGESGTDLEGIFAHGPDCHVRNDAKFRNQYPLIGLSPQCASGQRWDQPPIVQATLALVERVIQDYPVDPDRVYCTGLSMGGTGTWHMALGAPERFAAIVPISANAVAPEAAGEKLKQVAVWIICGGADGDYTENAQRMFKALEGAKPKPVLTLIPNEGHIVWQRYYSNFQFYVWLLRHRRPAPPVARPSPAGPASRTPTTKAMYAPRVQGAFGPHAEKYILATLSAATVFLMLSLGLLLRRNRGT